MKILVDNLNGREVVAFLTEHIQEMKSISPPESKHALDLKSLKKPDITFWTMRDSDCIVSCGAIKKLNVNHAELKSMRTATFARGRGYASILLQHIFKEARLLGYQRISLETGSMSFFIPAHNLYVKHGFKSREPFANYKEDPNSIFMTKEL